MLSGPHAGRTFLHIWETEHQYTHWVRLTAETHPEVTRAGLNRSEGIDPQILRLATYLSRKEQTGGQGYEEDPVSDEQFEMAGSEVIDDSPIFDQPDQHPIPFHDL